MKRSARRASFKLETLAQKEIICIKCNYTHLPPCSKRILSLGTEKEIYSSNMSVLTFSIPKWDDR